MYGNQYLQMKALEARKKKEPEKTVEDQIAESQQAMEKDMERGAELAKDVIGDGLGRLSENAKIMQSRGRIEEMAEGPTSAQNLAAREGALERLQGAEQSQQRSLLSALSNSGQVGGAAAAQLADLTSSNLANRRRMERDLIADQAAFGQQATRDLAQMDMGIGQFDLGQLAKEKNIDIQARLGYSDLGSAERSGIRSAQAIKDAAEAQEGGGTSFICTKLRELGLMSREETRSMTNFMLKAISHKARFLYWYITNMKDVVDSLEMSLEAWHGLKRISVDHVLQINKDHSRRAAQNKYIDTCISIATSKGVKVPNNVKTENKIINTAYLLALFTKKNTYSFIFKILKSKINLRTQKKVVCER